MAKETQRKIVFAATVLVLGSLALFACASFMGGRASEDEDRPPIIVRGGSLIFESGEGILHGKPWFEDAVGEWKQFHEKGRPTRVYDLTFVPETCTPRTVPEFTVFYDPDGTGSVGEQKFVVSRKPRQMGGGGTDGPAVVGTDLDNSNQRPYPRLIYPGSNMKIIRVEGPGQQVLCENPTKVTAMPKQ